MIKLIKDLNNVKKEEYVFPDYQDEPFIDDEHTDANIDDEISWNKYDSEPVYIPNEEEYNIKVTISHKLNDKDTEVKELSFIVDPQNYDYIDDVSNDIKSALRRIGDYVR